MSLSDHPLPHLPRSTGPRVVTIGGGHGQSMLLAALARLECEVTAIVGVADDGGCSGKLREELGMPPPGDLRRCLVSLSTDAVGASRFEERLHQGDEAGRCVGNLVLAELYADLGSLQAAADWASALLGCVGRVAPAAETPGVLEVWDREHGAMAGESNVERASAAPLVATVTGPEVTNPIAARAIARAQVIFLGPGSFVGSTLAALGTADVAARVARSSARRLFVKNLAPESEEPGRALGNDDDHERLLADHLLIASLGEAAPFDVLAHGPAHGESRRADRGLLHTTPLADASGRRHDPEKMVAALGTLLGVGPRTSGAPAAPSGASAQILERYLASARQRLFGA